MNTSACDETPLCPAEMHRPVCMGLWITEEELAAGTVPAVEVLERRRDSEMSLRRVASADRARNFGIGETSD